MRIAVNVEQLLQRSPGGIGRYTARLARLLPRLFPHDEVELFAALHQPGRLAQAAAGAACSSIRPLYLPRPVLYEAWHGLGWPRVDRLGPERADVVHAPSLAVPPRGSAGLVVTVHDAAALLYPEAFSAWGRRFHARGLAAAARRADRVITVSQAAADEIAAHSAIDAGRIRVVPNGVDHVEVDPASRAEILGRLDLAGGDPYVLWVGSLEPRKGVGTLVSAMASLARRSESGEPRRSPRARLVMAGYPGWLGDRLIEPADRAALGDRLVQVGQVDDAQLWSLYAGAALFAFPSRHEGFGLPVLEAMSQGTPVICSDLPALRETAAGAARLLPPGDPGAWAEAIEDLLGDESQMSKLAAAGRERAGRFSWEATVRATHQVYEDARRR